MDTEIMITILEAYAQADDVRYKPKLRESMETAARLMREQKTMNELPEGFERELTISFDQRALERLVNEVWGKDYDTGAALDRPHNGSHFDWEITGTYDELDEYLLDQGKKNIWENESDGPYNLERVIERLDAKQWFSPGPETVLTALVEIGKLPAGKYILDFWW